MTKLIIILLIIFILLTILRNIIRNFKLNNTQIKHKQNMDINRQKNQKNDDDITDAKFEELK